MKLCKFSDFKTKNTVKKKYGETLLLEINQHLNKDFYVLSSHNNSNDFNSLSISIFKGSLLGQFTGVSET